MIKAELFDVVELLNAFPDRQLQAGMQGAVVECYENNIYEVEFADRNGETIALCTLSPEQFLVVWQAQTNSWLSISERLSAVVDQLSDDRQQEVLNFARSLYPVNV